MELTTHKELKQELENIKAIENIRGSRTRALNRFIDKLAGLRFFDPAAGSGNFLTETYICIRRLENEALAEINKGQIGFSGGDLNPAKVSLDQFYPLIQRRPPLQAQSVKRRDEFEQFLKQRHNYGKEAERKQAWSRTKRGN